MDVCHNIIAYISNYIYEKYHNSKMLYTNNIYSHNQ